jgi:hypothetical protein
MRSLIRVAGGSVRGRSHERNGKPCQDKYYVWRAKDKKAAGIALADGAGSSSHSQIGAEYAVNAVLPFVQDQFTDFLTNPAGAGKRMIEFLLRGLSEAAGQNGLLLHDMACTLLFVYIRRKRKTLQYVAGHIGDGVIISEQGKEMKVLSEPARGEYANTTVFLTSKRSASYLRVYSGAMMKPAGFIIMSDGAAESLYIRKLKAPNQRYCQQIFDWCDKYPRRKITKALLMNLEKGVFREVTSDDCSLSVLKIT